MSPDETTQLIPTKKIAQLARSGISKRARSVAATQRTAFSDRKYRRLCGIEGLGMGDVKFATAGAPWLPWSHLQVALLIAVSAALLMVAGRALIARNGLNMRIALPFGAFLAPGVWVVWFAVAAANRVPRSSRPT
jgi:prepilin signal peptidase PulO-like enzyme (type II secretory pathway)